MTVKDYVSESIQEYPTLYKDDDYKKSMIKVLDHVFFTCGNGVKLAQCENEKDGGYPIYPYYISNEDGEPVRANDKPYGQDTYKSLPDDYFDSIIYCVSGINDAIDVHTKKDVNGNEKHYYRFKKVDNDFLKPKLRVVKSKHDFIPYPFSKDFCIACNVYYNDLFLQDDWKEALVLLCEETLNYFHDEERYCNDSNYPSTQRVNSDLKRFQEEFDKGGVDTLNKLQKIWGNTYEQTDHMVTFDEVKEAKIKSWDKFRAKQIKFLNKVIKKYKV